MRAALALLLVLGGGAAHARCDLDYALAARWSGTPRHFAATMSFDAGERTATRLAVSPDWGGVTDFHRALRNVRAEGRGVAAELDARGWTVTHPAGSRVTVRYEVHGDGEADRGTLDSRDFYRNQLGASHFHMFGQAMLPVPEGVAYGSRARACIAFEGLPRDWAFASGLGERQGTEGTVSFAAPIGAVVRSVFVGGDFRIVRREVAGKPVVFAMRGEWKFADTRFADAATAVIGTHREFWDDHAFARYLVTLIPNRLDSGSTGGTGVQDAFAMHASRDFAVPGHAFEFLIGHEHLHAWIPVRLGGLAAGPGEPAGYWFSEGFTNYLAHRLLLRSGVWSPADYAKALNEVIYEAATSPVAGARNERIRDDFWKDDAVQRLPYLRGELVALAFARLHERAGTSLERVLRDVAAAPPDGKPAPERFAAAAARHVPATRAMLEAYIERGERIPLEVGSLGPCFEGGARGRVPFELGFDRTRALKERRVHGVVEESAAHRAGLRDGMAIERLSVAFGKAEQEAFVQVRDPDGGSREIRYRPRGEPIVVMQYAPRDDAATRPDCARWLAPGSG